jgi:threonine dehydratase
MPITTPQVKIDAVKDRGGKWVKVVLFGESYNDAYDHALQLEGKAQAYVCTPL